MPSPRCKTKFFCLLTPNGKIADLYAGCSAVVVDPELHAEFFLPCLRAVFACLYVQDIFLKTLAELFEFLPFFILRIQSQSRAFFNKLCPHIIEYTRMCDVESDHIPEFVINALVLSGLGQIG